MERMRAAWRLGACLALATLGCAVIAPAHAGAITLPANFQESTPITGLTNPIAVRFSPDGRVFVGEKSGLIKVYDGLSDPTATVFADLRTNVYNFWDRGMLGMVLDPEFPVDPYVYVLYAHDAEIGGTAPLWGNPGETSDPCPTPPGPTSDGCVISGRLSRLTASGDVMSGPEQVLIEDWCQQYPSHSIGDLGFGADGALYVSGGDGASFTFTDWGQDGSPVNPCGDPLNQGGALRSQDLRSSGDPAGLDGAILRVDPATGASLPGNPFASSGDPNVRRTIAYGLRNPFRMTIRPGTSEVWVGDVGWNEWEEINRIAQPTDATAENFGWPCYEGTGRQPGYDSANLPLCEGLYSAGASAITNPYHAYRHADRVVAGESCPTGTSSIAGLDFYETGPFPNSYDGALFFADYSRDCIWAMLPGGNGLPNPATIQTFGAGASNPVALQVGPAGDLFYADFDGGMIRRVRYLPGNQPPTAVAEANPSNGPAPLNVQFDATDSSDPEDDPLSFAWDLDNDGAFDDSTSPTPSRTYTQVGQHTATVRVTDSLGAVDTDPVTLSVGNTPPQATITAPSPSLTWGVGEQVNFAATATDMQDGSNLPASAFDWELDLEHCPGGCHTHDVQSFANTKSGSFNAPDHEYPSFLTLTLTVTDSGGLTDTEQVQIDPETVELTLASNPAGLQLVLNGGQTTAPFTSSLILGSQNSVSAPSPQSSGGEGWLFSNWSDGGAQTHQLVADATKTLTAGFTVAPANPATVSKSGQITYQATPGAANDVTISLAGGNYTFLETGITAGAGCSQPAPNRVDCPVAGVSLVTLNLGDGNDSVTAAGSTHRRLALNGGDGDDALNGGDKKDTIAAGNGDDDLTAGAGDDLLSGGAGADRFDGGPGVDRALYDDHAAGINVDIEPSGPASDDDGNASDGAATSRDDVLPSIEWIVGTALADVLDATFAVTGVTLYGKAGADVITDGPFDDALNGGGGPDTINCVNGGNDSNVVQAADTVNGDC
jgi:glucose/arabinose dehydrogenase